MLQPAQPNTGGSNTGESVYCYSPWLEAPFSTNIVPASEPGTFNGQWAANNVGVQTNCMSCHGMASFAMNNTPDLTQTLYTADRYVDLEGPQFDGNLTVDFLWSIPGSATSGSGDADGDDDD
jgi:formate-dependent nitrite reductase cytochrome c552 subunit